MYEHSSLSLSVCMCVPVSTRVPSPSLLLYCTILSITSPGRRSLSRARRPRASCGSPATLPPSPRKTYRCPDLKKKHKRRQPRTTATESTKKRTKIQQRYLRRRVRRTGALTSKRNTRGDNQITTAIQINKNKLRIIILTSALRHERQQRQNQQKQPLAPPVPK